MILTVYQQVFVQGASTRTHITIVDESGAVLERRFATYEAYPLYTISQDHREFVLKALRRSFDVEKIVYDCNVQGRSEFTPGGRGWNVEPISHPRFGKYTQSRVIWHDPQPDDEEVLSEE